MDDTPVAMSPTPFRDFLHDLSTIVPPFTLIRRCPPQHERAGA
jgi:hypothetical protein